MPNIIALKDWKVIAAQESTTDSRVTAQYVPPPSVCPRCGVENPSVYKHDVREQEFMDAPVHGRRVHLIVKRQRYRCIECNGTFQELLPEMDENRTMTKRLLAYIQRLSLEKKFTEIADEVGVNEKTVRNIFSEYVTQLDAERTISAPEWLGIDELFVLKNYRCMLTAPGEKCIIDMLPDRDKTSVIKWMMALPNRSNVKVVTMDMWKPYRDAANVACPNAQVVVDQFHVVRMATFAADSLRVELKDELDPKVRRQLKRDRWIIRSRKRNLKATDMMLLRSWDVIVPMLYKAYEAKEDFYEIYEKAESREEAVELWELWKEGLEAPLRRSFKPLITAVENWKPEIFSFFDHGRKTNAYTEAMNSVVRVVDRAGRGYSFDAIRAKVLYGGKRRKTDSEYRTVSVAMKTKVKVLVEKPPKLHKEKRKRD